MRLLYILNILLLIVLNSCQNPAPPYQRVYQAPVEKDDAATRINNYILNFSDTAFNGVVMIAKKGEVLLSQGYGQTNTLTKEAFSPQTPIHIGALAKQFTAAAILQLEMKGLLSTGDSLKKYFDQLPNDKQQITIHNLLTHTAGLDANLDLSSINLQDWLITTSLKSIPGKKFRYSNAGYQILAHIIGQVSGHSHPDYLQKAIFLPLGMHQTSIQDSNWSYSTADDMYKWYKALATTDFLPLLAKDKFFQAYIPEGTNASNYHAYGWTVNQNNAKLAPVLAQSSTHAKGYAHMSYYPKADAFVLVATDQETSGTTELSQVVNRLLFKTQAIPAPPTTAKRLATLPSNGQGIQLAKLLDTLSNGKTEEMTALIQEAFAPSLSSQLSVEGHLSILQHLQQELQAAELTSVEQLGKNSYRLTLINKNNLAKNTLWVDLATVAPFAITNFNIDTVRG